MEKFLVALATEIFFCNDTISKILEGGIFVRKILLVALLLGFIAYAGFNLTENVTPYVGIAEATSSEKNVQVKGLTDKNFSPRQVGDEFIFNLQDEETGETMKVKFAGIKPDQFDDAYHVVAIGKYNAEDSAFHAKKLLIKCPSKYEGQTPPR